MKEFSISRREAQQWRMRENASVLGRALLSRLYSIDPRDTLTGALMSDLDRTRPTMRKPPHLRDHNITVFAHSVTLKVSVLPCEP